jgi:hypothetical protein
MTVIPGDPMASFRMLGRLLAVGLGAGALVGGVFAAVVVVLASAGADWMATLSIGVPVGLLVGMVAGLVVQAVTHVVVLVAGRPGLSAPATRLLAGVVPVVAAGGVAWWVAAALGLDVVDTVVGVVVVLVMSGVVVVATVGWALRPMVGGRR